MIDGAKTIHVDEDTALLSVLAAADEGPVRLAKGSVIYRIVREDEGPAFDADAIRAAIETMSGSWGDLDADAVIDYIHRAREEGTRPASRP